MDTLSQLLGNHHKHCDELFARAESAVLGGRWPEAADGLAGFRAALTAHLAAEETLLFPALESATGTRIGPTQVMRLEHAQMRELVEQMGSAVDGRSANAFSDAAETLLVLMQQHNMKEEHILYPMCDDSLAAAVPDVLGRVRRALESSCPV